MNNINLIFIRSMISGKDNPLLNADKEYFLKSLANNNITVSETGTPVFFIETGGIEEIFIKIYKNYHGPFYLLATDHSNSLPASLEILTFLQENNLEGKIIHGNLDSIVEQLKSDLIIAKNTKKSHELAVKGILMNKRYGIIGKPSDWLISSNVDYNIVKDIFGCELIDISQDEVTNRMKKYHIFLDKKSEVNLESTLILMALREIVNDYLLDGFTIRCFDLLSLVKGTSCWALAKFNEEGIIATCEGDIPSMLSMAVVKEINKTSSFQANPSYINIKENELSIAHCTLPLDMVSSYKITTHFESGIGNAIKGELKLQKAHIFKLHPNLKEYFHIDCDIVENLHSNCLCRTQIRVKTTAEVASLLDFPFANHLIVYYDNSEIDLKKVLSK